MTPLRVLTFTSIVPFLWLLSLALPLGAVAQSAQELYSEGVALRDQNNFDAALERFRRAYDLEPSARTLALLGSTELEAGLFVAAERDLLAVLAQSTDPFVIEAQAALRTNLARASEHLGWLLLNGGPDDALVSIQGIARGALGDHRRLRVRAGAVALEIHAGQYLPIIRNVRVQPGGTASEAISMVRAASSGPVGEPASTPVNVGPSSAAPTRSLSPADTGVAPDPESLTLIAGLQDDALVAWLSTAAFAGSTVGTLLWQLHRSDALTTCATDGCRDESIVNTILAEHDAASMLTGLGAGLGVGSLASAIVLSLSDDGGIDRGLPLLLAAGATALGAVATGAAWAEREVALSDDACSATTRCGTYDAIEQERNINRFTSMALVGSTLSLASFGLLALATPEVTEGIGAQRDTLRCTPNGPGISCRGTF